MRILVLLIISVIFCCTESTRAQNQSTATQPQDHIVHIVPFDSQGNVIELSFDNTESVVENQVYYEVYSSQDWLQVRHSGSSTLDLAAERVVRVVFDVPVDAPIKEQGSIVISIAANDGRIWQKNIDIEVALPEAFELRQSYPNPFNPTATVPFVVPENGRVRVVVYDILGRQVAILTNTTYEPGLHNVRFDGTSLASGQYLIRATMESESGIRITTPVQQLTLLK